MIQNSSGGRPLLPDARPQPAKFFIQQRGLTQWDVAREINVQPSLLCSILNGRRRPSAEVRQGLSRLLGLPEDVLFTSRVGR